MRKPLLREWLPLKDRTPKFQPSKGHQEITVQRTQALFPTATLIPAPEAIALWLKVVDRIDTRIAGQVATSREDFLYDYLEPHGTPVEMLPPSPEGYLILVEDFPEIAFKAQSSDLPRLGTIASPRDLYFLPASRPSWIVCLSHEGGLLPPFLVDLRKK